MTAGRRARKTLCGIAAPALVLAAAACGKSPSSTPSVPSSAPHSAPAATKNVGLLTWNLPGGEPRTLDPVKILSGGDLEVESNLCESLLTLTPSGGDKPGLATSVDRPNDTTYVAHLRHGVTFSDGKPMTASDVVFSLNRVRDPKLASFWASFASAVTSISATNSDTVTIKLSKPDALYYQMLATPMGQVVEQSYVQSAGSKYGSAAGGVRCTGPYTLQSWNSGTDIVLKANDKWWGRTATPQRAASVKFTFLTDDATITSALLNGDIDGEFDIPTTTVTKLQASPSGAVYFGPSTSQLVLAPTKLAGGSPLSNPTVRQAFADSIDYKGILASIMSGLGQPLRAAAPPGSWGYAQSVYQSAYDKLPEPTQNLERAKQLLAQSGEKNPTVTLAVPSDIPEYITIGTAIQSNAAQAGFKVNLKPLPSADFYALYSDPKARAGIDLFLNDYYADVPDPLELYVQFGNPGGAADFGGYKNQQVITLLTQAQQTIDDTKRAELTVQAQAILTKDLVWIPIAYPAWSLYLNKRFGGAVAAFPYVLYAPWLPSIGGR